MSHPMVGACDVTVRSVETDVAEVLDTELAVLMDVPVPDVLVPDVAVADVAVVAVIDRELVLVAELVLLAELLLVAEPALVWVLLVPVEAGVSGGAMLVPEGMVLAGAGVIGVPVSASTVRGSS